MSVDDELLAELARERQTQVRVLDFRVSPYPTEPGIVARYPIGRNSGSEIALNRSELRAWAAQMVAYADELDAEDQN